MEMEDGAMVTKVTTIVRQQTGDQLLVSACGRTCSVDMHHARSIVDLQAALQRKLQMEGQAFHICDINGALLSTDMQVEDAISQGLTPLCATLPDKSLHHLENRREELAQMQWKLVRDQMNQSNNQVTQITRQINELQFQIQANHREAANSIDHFRQEILSTVDKERSATKAEMAPLHEAVNGAVLLINGERSKRELAVQGFEKHIHGVCDMLDGERASRRQDLAMHMSVMQDLRSSLDLERNARTELEESHMDLKRSSIKFQDEVRGTLRDQADKVSKLQSDLGVSISDIMGRFGEMEDRMAMLEKSISEMTSSVYAGLDKVTERHERVAQTVETMRLGHKHYEGSIANCLERTNELEHLVRQYDGEIRDQVSKEKQVRDDQVRRASQVFTNESLKHVTELEKRLTVRLERESAEREKNFTGMMDEVTKIIEDRKLFRDQTITKTVNVARTLPAQGSFTSGSAEVETSGYLGASQNSYQPPRDSYQPPASDVTIPDGAHEKALPLCGSERVIRTVPLLSSSDLSKANVGTGGFVASAGQIFSYPNSPAAQRSPTPQGARVGAVPYGTTQLPTSVYPAQSGGSQTSSRNGSVRMRVQASGGSLSAPLSPTGMALTGGAATFPRA